MSREVPRVPLSEITAEEFRERYMVPNEPVLLTGAAQGWRATAEWIDHAGQPAVGELATLFPRSQVTVVDGAGRRQEMSLSEYSAWWAGRDGAAPLYLKDWHLPCHHPEYGAYELPEHVADDWLNEHWAASSGGGGGGGGGGGSDSGGDHRFVYVGPAGSRTALHADVFFSFSWSANVVGAKRWWLLPAAHRRLASDEATRPLAGRISQLPEAAALAVEVVQGPGELLFVPSGWFHEVENTADTISINHNWLNACNAHWGLLRLREVLRALRRRAPPPALPLQETADPCHKHSSNTRRSRSAVRPQLPPCRCSPLPPPQPTHQVLGAVRAGLGPDAADHELCMQLLRRRPSKGRAV